MSLSRDPNHIRRYQETRDQYPVLHKAAEVLERPPADIIGRDIGELRRGLRNPEKANIALLAEPGTGKTAYVQGFAYDKDSLPYYLVLNVNPERLIDKAADRDNALLTGFGQLLEEARRYGQEQDVIVILFIDEFHKLADISPNLLESIKPKLEKSAMNGFRLVAATTFQEYNEKIAGNRALDQRFLKIKLSELPKDAVISILENRAKQHEVLDLLEDGVLDEVYVQSKRILIDNAQPRASIDVLNSMIGDTVKKEYMKDGTLHKEYYTPKELGLASEKVICRPLLKRIIQRTHGIDIDNEVEVTEVITALKTRLYDQDLAIETIVAHLEMAAQGFGELDRPKISFLSTGSTGTGKSIIDSERIPAPVESGYIRNGDLKVGDYVYSRTGKPVQVIGVYPQGLRTVYRVTLTDGRQIDCARDHLWTYRNRAGNGARYWKTVTTEELMKKNLAKPEKNGRIRYDFVLPQNEAVERKERQYHLNPYALGAFLGNGSFMRPAFEFSSNDEETVHRLEQCLALPAKRNPKNYSWHFITGTWGTGHTWAQTKDLLQEVPELIGKKSGEKFIPDCYKFGSIKQRWALIQGLFDTDGSIRNDSRHNVSFGSVSERLIHDVQEVLWSLGIMSSITSRSNRRKGKDSDTTEYTLHVKVPNKDKQKFFRLPRKRKRAKKACMVVKQREKKFDTVAIKSIEKLDHKEPMTCIMVEDPEHLYLAGKGHIVTHNTQLAKIISETMRIPLKRFDMSRYSAEADAGAFADALFQAAWATPNAYILIDEVEKSSKKAMNILLQVLDDARLTDSVNPDRVASFSGCIINLTTNLGSEIYQNMARHQGAGATTDFELVYKALSNSDVFETAVLGRLDAVVPFQPLPMEALEKIARQTLSDIIEGKETDKRRIIVSPDVIPYIIKDRTSMDTERGGARDAKRNVKNLVAQKLAHYLTYANREVPVLIYIEGEPRFKNRDVADPMNAQVALKECHPIELVDALLAQLSQKVGKPLLNKGLYLPADVKLALYGQDIVKLALNGYNKFKSEIDGERVYVVGV